MTEPEPSTSRDIPLRWRVTRTFDAVIDHDTGDEDDRGRTAAEHFAWVDLLDLRPLLEVELWHRVVV